MDAKHFRARTTPEQQLAYITQCRQSGMTDADWCRENDIPISTFYSWVGRCRKNACSVPAPSYGHSVKTAVEQDVVPVNIVAADLPSKTMAPAASSVTLQEKPYLDNSHTIEVSMQSMTIRISNQADLDLLAGTLRLLKELSC